MSRNGTIYVVDDDPEICGLIELIISATPTLDYTVITFSSAEAFLAAYDDGGTDARCLLLDVRLPGIGGPELQQRLRDSGAIVPVIILTGYAEVGLAVRTVKSGALNVLQKPVPRAVLINQIEEALAYDARNRAQRESTKQRNDQLESLTPREREVLDLILEGHNTKEIATRLGIGLQTVAKHRARALKKLDAKSPLDVARR